MKMNYLKISVMLLAGTMLACSDDDEKANPNKPEFPTEFSGFTPEQNKANLEDNGIELINSIEELKDASGIEAMIAFGNHVSGSEGLDNLEGGRKNGNGTAIARLLAAFGEGKSSASQTLSGMRIAEDDFASFEDEFNSAVGVYTYDKTNDTWSYTETGDKITFKFPSTEEGTSNNAEFSVFGYEGVEIESNLGGDDYTGDYPTALQAELKIDGSKEMGYSFSASYNGNGDPKTVSQSVEIDAFKFSYDVKNTVEEVSVNYALTENGNNLLSFGASGEGNFDTGDAEDAENPEEVVTYAGAYFQIMNIKFSGEFDFNKFAEAYENEEEVSQADALNEAARFVVFYADSKEKIADTEFYETVRETCYEEYDYDLEEWVEVCYEEESVDIRLIFADETNSDLETYTDVGFSDLEEKLEDFVDSFE